MSGYLYETHLHTSEGSACARTPGREYAAFYKALGYDGIFVTDHFFQGNTAAPRTGLWEDRVDAYMRGYEQAREAGEKIGLKVFFGIEQNFSGDEYLLYGLDRDFLTEHRYIEAWSRQKLFDEVHAAGGCVVQAHPFRERNYIRKIHFALSGIDAVEAVNMGNEPYMDQNALLYARELGFPVTCGSDIHRLPDTLTAAFCGGVRLERPLADGKDFARAIRNREPMQAVYPADRLTQVQPRMPMTPWEADAELCLEKVLGTV